MTASEVAQYLRQNDRYLIISHRNPDGDTLGCAGAICSALREIGKTAYVLNNEQITKRYEEYVSEFIAPEDYVPETILTADVASLEMLPDNAGRYADRIDLSVDHHAYNGLFARHNCVMGEKAACGEIVFNIILKMKGSVSVKCAELLFIAISTDTGCFKYNNTTSDTMRIAAELLDIGIRADKIRKEMFMTRTRNRLIFEGMVNRGMEFFCEGRVAVKHYSQELFAAHELYRGALWENKLLCTLRFGSHKYVFYKSRLHDDSPVQNGHLVADLLHHLHLVGDYDYCNAHRVVNIFKKLQNGAGGVGVKGRGGLIAQKNFWVCCECACNGDALLLSA